MPLPTTTQRVTMNNQPMRAPRAPVTINGQLPQPTKEAPTYNVDNRPISNQGVPAPEKDKWLTIKECADYLGINPNTMREMIRKDNTPVFRLNRSIRIRKSEFKKLIERHMGPLED